MKNKLKRGLAAAVSAVMMCGAAGLLPSDYAPAIMPFTANAEDGATVIESDKPITGYLAKDSEIDSYQFTLTERGVVSLDFERAFVNNSACLWGIFIFDDLPTPNLIDHYYCTGNEQNRDVVKSVVEPVGLNAGTYTVQIVSGYKALEQHENRGYSNEEYTLTLHIQQDGGWESEPNNTLENADSLALNSSVKGRLNYVDLCYNTYAYDEGSDCDWYTFEVTKSGYIQIDFSRPYAEHNKFKIWKLDLYDSYSPISNLIYTQSFTSSETVSDNVVSHLLNLGLEKGTYRLRIRSDYEAGLYPEDVKYDYMKAEYTLTLNFTPDDYWESELNDTVETADEIQPNIPISGNLRTKNDVDYYTVTVPEDGYCSFTFAHDWMDSVKGYWCVSMYDVATPKANNINNSYWYFSGKTDDSSVVVSQTTKSWGIPKGTYILKVSVYDSNYSDLDYKLTLDFTASNSWETEPNDTIANADPLSLNSSIYGYIIKYDTADCFTFTLDKEETVVLDFIRPNIESNLDCWKMTITDSALPKANQVYSGSFKGNESISSTGELVLAAGTYNVMLTETSGSGVNYELALRKTFVPGDLNADGRFDTADVVLLQKWLLTVPDTKLANWTVGDFLADGKLDVRDLSLMKQDLLNMK